MATMAQTPHAIHRGLRQRARLSLVLTAIAIGIDIFGFRTNWLLPPAHFCGTIQADGSWTEEPQLKALNRLTTRQTRVCIRELIQPYSHLSGSATVAMSVQTDEGSMRLFDAQFFIGRELGPKRHNDTPGDWIFLRETRYNPFGWRISHKNDAVASWSSDFYTLALRRQIWQMVQKNLGGIEQDYDLSLRRQLGAFMAINGAMIVCIALAIYGLFELIGLPRPMASGEESRRYRGFHWLRALRQFKLQHHSSGRVLFILAMLAAAGLLVLSRYSSRFALRPFWCKTYPDSWRVCLHEIHRAPTPNLRMIVMNVSIRRPDQTSMDALMQFFTALPKDKIGFNDVPGSWHFQDIAFYDKNGWLSQYRPRTLSSIVDPLVPSPVQLALWYDVATHVQEKYKARRLSLQTKLLEVSDTYLFMLLTVMLATSSTLSYLKIWLLNQQLRATESASTLQPCSEKISTS